MRPLLASIALAALVGAANGQTTVLFPNGDFDHPAGAAAPWVETYGGGVAVYSYPTTGGNPNGYGVIDATATGTWAIWVGGNSTPLPIAPMGLVAGNTYYFVQDMKSIIDGDGNHPPGLKIESWGPSGKISDSSDMTTPITSSWQTYSFPYTIALGATGIKVVPLWSSSGKVAYDNIGVQVPPQSLIVSITTPADSDSVSTNFTIAATATVSPGSVTNVAFYDGATLLGNSTGYPYSINVSHASVGAHVLAAVARDSNGNSATSDVVNVTVAGLAPPPPTYPTTNAPTPIWPKSSVISAYNSSATYPNISPINWYPWGSTKSSGDYQIIGGNIVKSYLGLGYAGVEVNPSYNLATALNLSKMTTMHVDVWTTANQMAIKVVSAAYNGAAPEVIYNAASGVITSNNWVSLDIPLSVFTNINPALNLAAIDQLLWIDNGDIAGTGVQLGDFYIDNVYFYNNTPIIQSTAISGTNFTLKVATQAGLSYVLQATPSLAPSAWTGIQTNTGTGKMMTFTTPITAANPVRFFRVEHQ